MSKRYILFLMLFSILALLLATCGPAPMEEAAPPEDEAPTEEEAEAAEEEAAPAEEEIPVVTANDEWTTVIQDFDSVEMALVPAGCFMMGSAEDEIDSVFEMCKEARGEGSCDRGRFDDEKPQHKICFDEPFWIDVYEVTNAQYGEASPDCTAYSSDDDQPRICIDWHDSQAHCESRGARLPTEAEWEYAARGPDGSVYPWGNTFDGSRLNFCDTNCLHGHSDKSADDGYANTAPVGTYPGGASWVGAYDLSGNVWEWVNDWYAASYPAEAQVNPTGPGSGELRVMRGGSWGDALDFARAAERGRDTPGGRSDGIGFRCARSYD
jgi:formylglycine-generating enzyme required for sulfatase activity